GNDGQALSLVCNEEFKLLKDIEKLIKKVIPRTTLAGFEPGQPLPPSVLDNRPPKPKKPKKTHVEHHDGQRSGANTASNKKHRSVRGNFVGG
ncbi:MAG TPA: ATP-dependent RNA helicase RhlE, partial [Psychromonas sp.]